MVLKPAYAVVGRGDAAENETGTSHRRVVGLSRAEEDRLRLESAASVTS